jgi:hypothetical protein
MSEENLVLWEILSNREAIALLVVCQAKNCEFEGK